MADTTDIYGIRFPEDGDSIDTAGDMRQLAETSEIALGGVNWDTATDEQKAAVAASTAPVSLFGTGRPDTENITAPTGSTYTFAGDETELEAEPILGARVWRRTPDAWVCIEGKSPRRRFTRNAGFLNPALDDGRIDVQRFGGGVMDIYVWGSKTSMPSDTPLMNTTGWQWEFLTGQGWYVPNQGQYYVARMGSPDQTGFVRFSQLYVIANGSNSSVKAGFQHADPDAPWPKSLEHSEEYTFRTVEELRELITEIENDPEKAEQSAQLRQELEALQAEAGE